MLKELNNILVGYDARIETVLDTDWVIIRNNNTVLYRWRKDEFNMNKFVLKIEENLTKKHIYGSAREARLGLYDQVKSFSRGSKLETLLDIK
jgi:hypothetical protein